MPIDRFFIAPYDADSGLQRDRKPFMITDKAFAELNNAYAWRGRIRKRFGSRWLGETQQSTRFRVNVGTTDGAGAGSGTVPANAGAIGQMFSIGNNLFTVNALGTPANLLVDGTATTATFDTSNGNFVFTGTSLTTIIYWYPALPVMGLQTFENGLINNEPVIGFDTSYAYQYNNGTMGWERLAGEITPGAATWTGTNSEFFWTTTYAGANAFDFTMYVTNFNELEPNYMRTFFNGNWDNFRPQIDATNFLNSARILIPFKLRLLAFNTWEGAAIMGQNQFPNRLRYCQIGSPLDVDAWRIDIPGKGGAVDCATLEAVVTVEYVKDRLIVFMEKSTWEIVYTGNEQDPFAWQQINTELGAESTFSIVPFDKVAIGVGNVGIMACTGTNVDRIDERIPDEVFKIHNIDAGVERVYGIRDYFVEMVYWAFPATDASATFPYPNRILVYNYRNGTWSFNDDSITAFGYFQPVTGTTWDSTLITWDDDESWDSGSLTALFRQVVAGNQQGWTFIVDADETTNSPALQITDITVAAGNVITITSVNHNLRIGDYVYFQDITQSAGNITLLNDTIFPVSGNFVPTANTFQIVYDTPGVVIDPMSVYTGGGVMARVSQIQLLTKQYNFYLEKGRNAYVSKIDFLVDRTANGEIEVDFYVSTAPQSMVADSNETSGTGSLLGSGNLETFAYPTVPFEAQASQVWHPYYLQADGEFIQLNIELNDQQMRDTDIREDDFQLHTMIFYAVPTSSRMQ